MRKRLIFIILTPVLMACISCNKQESSILVPQLKDYPVSVTTKGSDTDTKVILDGHDFTWSQGDMLKMLAVTSSGENATAELTLNDIDAGFASGRFAGTVTISAEPNNCYFAYPSSTSISYSGSSAKATYNYGSQNENIAPYLYGSSAYSATSITCILKHIGGMLHLTIPTGITSITVQGNNKESIATAVCDLSSATPTATVSGSTSFSVSVTDGATDCYITMPPVNFTKGFSLIFTDSKGGKMYKSYNFDTACDFTSTYSGKIIPINVDSFTGFSFSAPVAYGHLTSTGTLTGTKVSMVNAAYQGIPSKLISKWGIDIKDKDNKTVKSISDLTVADFGSTYLAIGNTDYLKKGTYTSHPYIILIDGTTLYGSEVSFETTPPSNLAITSKVTTSYSYYQAGNITTANTQDGSTVYIEQCSINISPEVLSQAGATATYTYDGATTTTTFSGSSLSTPNKTSQAWSSHTFLASVTFDGLTITSPTTTVQVTGLPYSANPPSTNNGWTAGDYTSFNSSYMRMGLPVGSWQTGKSYATSPTWNIPSNINISISILYSSKTTASNSHTLSAALYNGSSESTVLVSDNQRTVTNKTITGNGTLTSTYNRLHFTNTGAVVGRYCDIYNVTISYK